MDFLLSHPELHESFRKGDDETLGMVYEDLEPELIELFTGGFLVESTGMRVPPLTNPDDVADLVSETMLLVLAPDVRARWDGERPFSKYAFATARNLRVTHYRKTHREKPSSDRESYENAELRIGGAAEPEKSRVPPEAQKVLDQYLANAPDRIRALHVARHDDDLSREETGKRLGISETRVHQLEQRMLRELHKLMKRAGVHSSADRLTPSPGEARHG